MRPFALLLAVLRGLVACPAASAAIARSDVTGDSLTCSAAHVVFEAAPGERER